MHTYFIEFEFLSHSYKRFFVFSDYKIINYFFLVHMWLLSSSLSLSSFHSFHLLSIWSLLLCIAQGIVSFFFFLPYFYQVFHQKLLKCQFFLNDLRSFYILNFHMCFSLLFQKFLFCSTIHLFTCLYPQEVVFINYSVTIRIVNTFVSFQSLKNKDKDCWKS